MATIRDVAKLADVSISTVSRVINGSKRVSPQLRAKVERAIDTLGFTTNSLARGLKSSQSNCIGVILPALSRIFFTSVLEGISQTAKRYGYSLQISESHDSLETEENLVRYYAAQWVDGIILASVAFDSNPRSRQYCDYLAGLEKNGKPIPVVTLEYPCLNPMVDSVVVDHFAAAVCAVNHLLDLGRSRLLHIAVPLFTHCGQQRMLGYSHALKSRQIPFREELVYEGDYTPSSGFNAVTHLLEQNILFDGIFAANDQMAVGALMACKQYGLSVPDQVAIIGNDNIFVTTIVSPTLSSISVPRYEMGATAMELLHTNLSAGGDKKQGEIITLETSLIRRQSSLPGQIQAANDFKSYSW